MFLLNDMQMCIEELFWEAKALNSAPEIPLAFSSTKSSYVFTSLIKEQLKLQYITSILFIQNIPFLFSFRFYGSFGKNQFRLDILF